MTLEDTLAENQRLYTERTHFALQLKEQLDCMREESAVHVTKVKDVAECQKVQHTEYIQSLESQLAKSRAAMCYEIKKRENVSRLECFWW